MDRRFFLRGAALLGCSAAASPWLTTVTLASAEDGKSLGDNRLIVIILRGAMDGLGTVMPVGDPLFAQYRPKLGQAKGALPLDGYFALHKALGGLMPLWQGGELAFVHATSTPYRDKRSHFDGQDMLEAGTGMDVPLGSVRDGWMNRMLQAVPGVTAETAYAVGRDALPMLAGAAEVRNWAPDLKLNLTAPTQALLQEVYHDDALFRDAATEALAISAEIGDDALAEGMAPPAMAMAPGAVRLGDIDKLVDFAAGRLRGETRIAAFSQSGWDTHANQEAGLSAALTRLERTVLRLQQQLGPEIWSRTTVMSMTEFGRTVHENGTAGTDHGTGGLMLLAGGAVKGGKVYGGWPGLAEADLYQRRDLNPTSDVRAWAAWTMAGLYGFDRAVLEGSIFPGLQMGANPGFLR